MRILVVEDDPTTLAVVKQALRVDNNEVDTAHTRQAALRLALANNYDLLILDRMLPAQDGLELLQELRHTQTSAAVIFLTAKASIQDRIEGLDIGADDYVVKPFALGELLARVNAVMRRYSSSSPVTAFEIDTLKVNLPTRQVFRGSTPLNLRPREFRILELLLRNKGQAVTKSMLLKDVWGLEFDPQTSVIQTNVSRLRAKVDLPGEIALVHTVRGVGYKIDLDP